MLQLSELLDMQSRGESIEPNPNNKVTRRRKGAAEHIAASSDNDPGSMYNQSMEMLGENINRLQEYVLSRSEEPAPELPDLVNQVVELRKSDIGEIMEVLDFSPDQALVHLEEQEDRFEKDYGYVRDEFLGHLQAPLMIAYNYQKKGNSYDTIDPALLSGVFNTVGVKLSSAELRRAAQDKPAGVVGTLAPGGKKHYDALRAYFKAEANKKVREAVLAGQISDESQLPGWGANVDTGGGKGKGPLDPLVDQQMKRAIPYIIGFVVIIGLVVYFASRSRK